MPVVAEHCWRDTTRANTTHNTVLSQVFFLLLLAFLASFYDFLFSLYFQVLFFLFSGFLKENPGRCEKTAQAR
jgi:hypothetical protein